MSYIDIENVSYAYQGARGVALQNVSLSIEEGEFVCIIGHSGCGKSTLLRLLAGLSLPNEGSIRIGGSEITGTGLERSIVFQNYSLFPWLTVERNAAIGLERVNKEKKLGLTRDQIIERALERLEQVDMRSQADRFPYELSGGMKQRVAIARALSMDTEVLLLDEPFGALDVKNRSELQDLMETLRMKNTGKTFIFVTHDIQEAIKLADRIIFMEPGKISAEFTIDFSRPRDTRKLAVTDEYLQLEDELTQLFYRNGASSADRDKA